MNGQVENHWFDPGRAKRVDVFTTIVILLSIKYHRAWIQHLETLTRFPFHFEIFVRWCCPLPIDIYSPFIVNRHVNPNQDGPTSNHLPFPWWRVVCTGIVRETIARGTIWRCSFWFLFRIKSRQFNSPLGDQHSKHTLSQMLLLFQCLRKNWKVTTTTSQCHDSRKEQRGCIRKFYSYMFFLSVSFFFFFVPFRFQRRFVFYLSS